MTLKSIFTCQTITLLILLFACLDYVNYFCLTISYLIYNKGHELLSYPNNKNRKYSWKYVIEERVFFCKLRDVFLFHSHIISNTTHIFTFYESK